jgi:hypothetical protein
MDTTSVRYVNADAADKFAGFDLRRGKLPRVAGPTTRVRGSIPSDRVPAVLAVTA